MNLSSVQLVTIDQSRAGQRLDNFLLSQLKGVPKSWVYRVIRKGEVRVNSKRVKPLYHIKAGDQVRIPPVRTAVRADQAVVSEKLAEVLKQAIIYEDDSLLIVNKPSGMTVHAGTGVSIGLIESMRQIRSELPFLELVHRIDRDTSGCVMLAKNRGALNQLQSDLKEKTVQKTYWCLVHGAWDAGVSRIDRPLLRVTAEASGERFVRVSEDGKASSTRFRVLESYKKYTLMQASPLTGRTHQIRVHCQSEGHSIVGDVKYSTDSQQAAAKTDGLNRLYLHAAQLEFNHPDTGKQLSVEAALEKRFEQAIRRLKKSA